MLCFDDLFISRIFAPLFYVELETEFFTNPSLSLRLYAKHRERKNIISWSQLAMEKLQLEIHLPLDV